VADAVTVLLSGPDPATAVIAGNNRVAVHLLRALAHAERRPAMISFDDFELADLLDPPVTVIANDVSALGHAAAELLFARIQGDQSTPRKVVLPVHLVARGSGEATP
jgi:LacI family transcriptional regulator